MDRLERFKQVLQLVEEENLLPRVAGGPVAQQRQHDLRVERCFFSHRLTQRRVLGHVERHAIGEMHVVVLVLTHLVERDKRPLQCHLVLRSNRHREPVDDRRENLQQLGHAAMAVRLIEELVEGVVDGATDGGTTVGQLAVDAMRHRLQTLALARIDRVEECHQMRHEGRCDVVFPHIRINLLR